MVTYRDKPAKLQITIKGIFFIKIRLYFCPIPHPPPALKKRYPTTLILFENGTIFKTNFISRNMRLVIVKWPV